MIWCQTTHNHSKFNKYLDFGLTKATYSILPCYSVKTTNNIFHVLTLTNIHSNRLYIKTNIHA